MSEMTIFLRDTCESQYDFKPLKLWIPKKWEYPQEYHARRKQKSKLGGIHSTEMVITPTTSLIALQDNSET